MFEHYFAVIMAGGGGTRLWPLSRQATPKQMLKLFGQRTLFELAIDRLEGLFPADHIYVVTIAEQAAELIRLKPGIPRENFLIEPMPRGTASVVGLATVALLERDPKAIMAILTADHYVKNVGAFREVLEQGYEVASSGWLVTLGIKPTFPSTGYGYIQRGEHLEQFDRFLVYRVLRFKEKPLEDEARALLAGNNHDWNSGMFIWQADRIREEFRRSMPDLFTGLETIAGAWSTPTCQDTVLKVWSDLKNETIDYGIMEHAQEVAVLPAANLGWNDVGSWESLFDIFPGDPSDNIILDAHHIGVDTKNTLVLATDSNTLLVTIGVSDLVIVETGDTLLVCHKDQAQKVRQVVNQLRAEGRTEYL